MSKVALPFSAETLNVPVPNIEKRMTADRRIDNPLRLALGLALIFMR